MKRLVIAGVVTIISLSGCGNSETDNRNVVVQERSDSDIFVDIVRDNVPSSSALNDRELVEFGNSICDALDDGNSLGAIGMVGVQSGMRPQDIGFIIGASVAAFCPEYEDDINNFGSDRV